MPKAKQETDYHKYDNVDTDILEAFLKADFNAPESEQLEPEAILYILDLLAEREKDKPAEQPNPAAAWADFCENYYPLLENPEMLYDFYNDVEPVSAGKPGKMAFLHKLVKPWRRFASAVAILVLLLFGGSLTAYALGYDPLAAIAGWGEAGGWPDKPPVTQELIERLAVYRQYSLVPKWLPSGYNPGEIEINDYPHHLWINAGFYAGDNRLFINYDAWGLRNNEPAGVSANIEAIKTLYEIDFASIVRYSLNNVDYYILGSDARRSIVWQNGKFVGTIVGEFSLSDATRIINSIYEN